MRHDVLGCGVAQVGNRGHCSVRRAHTENNQIGHLNSSDFQNPLRRGSELATKLDQAFHMTPSFGFRWHQFFETALH